MDNIYESITPNQQSPQVVRGFFLSNNIKMPFKKIIRKRYSTVVETGLAYVLFPINHPIQNPTNSKFPEPSG